MPYSDIESFIAPSSILQKGWCLTRPLRPSRYSLILRIDDFLLGHWGRRIASSLLPLFLSATVNILSTVLFFVKNFLGKFKLISRSFYKLPLKGNCLFLLTNQLSQKRQFYMRRLLSYQYWYSLSRTILKNNHYNIYWYYLLYIKQYEKIKFFDLWRYI